MDTLEELSDSTLAHGAQEVDRTRILSRVTLALCVPVFLVMTWIAWTGSSWFVLLLSLLLVLVVALLDRRLGRGESVGFTGHWGGFGGGLGGGSLSASVLPFLLTLVIGAALLSDISAKSGDKPNALSPDSWFKGTSSKTAPDDASIGGKGLQRLSALSQNSVLVGFIAELQDRARAGAAADPQALLGWQDLHQNFRYLKLDVDPKSDGAGDENRKRVAQLLAAIAKEGRKISRLSIISLGADPHFVFGRSEAMLGLLEELGPGDDLNAPAVDALLVPGPPVGDAVAHAPLGDVLDLLIELAPRDASQKTAMERIAENIDALLGVSQETPQILAHGLLPLIFGLLAALAIVRLAGRFASGERVSLETFWGVRNEGVGSWRLNAAAAYLLLAIFFTSITGASLWLLTNPGAIDTTKEAAENATGGSTQ